MTKYCRAFLTSQETFALQPVGYVLLNVQNHFTHWSGLCPLLKIYSILTLGGTDLIPSVQQTGLGAFCESTITVPSTFAGSKGVINVVAVFGLVLITIPTVIAIVLRHLASAHSPLGEPRAIHTQAPPRIYGNGGIPFDASLACATIREQADKAQEEEEDERLTSGMHILVRSWYI
ncbi:uncharacterized protein EAF01_008009 [Botrytis porri]|uniref:Uncharacterized protein n=1 Tax=Botrytis porri TaxID=87229 RepID=A0A4Z1KCH1_9HELO|nr:uncharacterized protein EAF01_008009 [Botrytis porri]KAF7900707.1 hypothetical protein EAF01_008009 [Botrytis porri]TGO83797.1 hypothetical protein BPOR_0591g00010 [Botrytis porri]